MKADNLVLNGIWLFTLPLITKYRNEVGCTCFFEFPKVIILPFVNFETGIFCNSLALCLFPKNKQM